MTVKQDLRYRDAIMSANEAKADFDRRDASGEFDQMDDDLYREMMDKVYDAAFRARMAYSDAKIKGIRADEWTKAFLDSFGEEEPGRKLTDRQARVFQEKGKYSVDIRGYIFRYNGKVYQISMKGYQTQWVLKIRNQYFLDEVQ